MAEDIARRSRRAIGSAETRVLSKTPHQPPTLLTPTPMASLLRMPLGLRAPLLATRALSTTPRLCLAPPPGEPGQPTARSQGLLGSLLHGSEEAKEEGRIDMQSHSHMVARGKYIHQIVKHKVPPHKTEEYKALMCV